MLLLRVSHNALLVAACCKSNELHLTNTNAFPDAIVGLVDSSCMPSAKLERLSSAPGVDAISLRQRSTACLDFESTYKSYVAKKTSRRTGN